MLPSQLRTDQFREYPPAGRQLAVSNLSLLRQLTLIYLASLLREMIRYDWKFPAERGQIDRQLAWLASLDPQELHSLFAGFAQIRLDRKLEDTDWVKMPDDFSERLTAYLWSTHQIDALRSAATEFTERASRATPAPSPAQARLGIVVIGRSVEQSSFPLFRKLRPYGVHFTRVDPTDGLEMLLHAVAARASARPIPYDHWYIEGSTPVAAPPHVSISSYDQLQPVRSRLLDRMQQVIDSGSGGPELLEVTMATIDPQQLGMKGEGRDGVLDHFDVSLLTQGQGTQIFSTTFVMWAAREALRRAEPVTLMARFTPRQRLRPMNELMQSRSHDVEPDPQGSLLDADMAAYYIWLDQQRLADSAQASFLVWFEGHNEALAIAPGLPRGTESASPGNLQQILEWIS